jgi:hypothetical protein
MKPYIRIFLKDTAMQRWLDIKLPEGVNSITQFMGQAHFEGFVCNNMFYVPVGEIKVAMLIQRDEAEPAIDFTKGSTLQ